MTCEERKEQLLLYRTGLLDEEERRALDSHLRAGCPRCTGALAEAEALFGQVPLVLDPLTPAPAVRERLMARVAGDPFQNSPSASPRPFRERWFPAAAAAVITFLLVSLIFNMGQTRLETELGRQESRIAELESATAETAELKALVARQDKEIHRLRAGADRASRTARLLRSPGTEIIELAARAAGLEASARVMWDREQEVGHFFAAGLRASGQAKTYQLWFITADDEKISAGIFDVDAAGEAELQMRVPSQIGPIAAAAVTDEPAGGSPQPTGSIQLVGAVALPSA